MCNSTIAYALGKPRPRWFICYATSKPAKRLILTLDLRSYALVRSFVHVVLIYNFAGYTSTVRQEQQRQCTDEKKNVEKVNILEGP